MILDTRLLAAVTGVGVVALLGGGWVLGAQPMFAAAEAADMSTQAAAAQNQALQTRLTSLAKLSAKSESMRAENATLKKAVPSILEPNTFVDRVSEVAALNGVTVESITLGDAVAYTAPVAAAAPAPVAAGTATSTPAPTETAATTTTTAAEPTLAATDPLITPADFTSVPVSLALTGTKAALLAFSTAIQNDARVFLIDHVTTGSVDTGGSSATLSGNIYTLDR